MKPGQMQKLFEYAFGNIEFDSEIMRALREFFDRPNLTQNDLPLEKEEDEEARFNEWLLFDFRLQSGNTIIEKFVRQNPYHLSVSELQIYHDLLENSYGLYEVVKIERGKGFDLRNLQTNTIYTVQEFLATLQIQKGNVFAGRVGKVEDHRELIGASPFLFAVQITPSVRKLLKETKGAWSPKIINGIMQNPKEPDDVHIPLLEEAAKNLQAALATYQLNSFVSTQEIARWIAQDIPDKKDFTQGLNLVIGLLPQEADWEEATDKLIPSYTDFVNACPRKEFGEKSSLEKKDELDRQGHIPELVWDVHPLDPEAWLKEHTAAISLMKQGKFEASIQRFEVMFKELRKMHTTFSEIFRPYANKGVCHLALGDQALGKTMLSIALELNPYYDFAKKTLREHAKEQKEIQTYLTQLAPSLPMRKKLKELEKQIEDQDKKQLRKDSAYQYYQYLKPYRITFAHSLKQKSKLTLIRKDKGKSKT